MTTLDIALETDTPLDIGSVSTAAIDIALETDEAPLFSGSTYMPPSSGCDFGGAGNGLNFGGSTTTSDSGGTSATVNNAGTAPVLPVLVVAHQITNPELRNTTTSKSLRVLVALGSGDSLVVDMASQSITLNGAPLFGMIDPAHADFWSLVPGNNVLRLYGSNVSGATLTVNFRSASL